MAKTAAWIRSNYTGEDGLLLNALATLRRSKSDAAKGTLIS